MNTPKSLELRNCYGSIIRLGKYSGVICARHGNSTISPNKSGSRPKKVTIAL
jgi:hypothetical protein